ncbi:uncharacterized protein LOC131158262 [Malania oleifera]|uniref:uncharacterized protein LOC131158262 n=1 Tax=Malania oleifera TaxID=397392 RepID=UPI0025AE36C8|nr:uncharacterized protein LOC131158262 [Malania oleifera]
MDLSDLNKVWEIKPLKKKVREDDARKILEKIAKQVQPIMRKHKWRVKLLSEFCPNNPSLLGLNVGSGVHVKLRLRRPNRDADFFPFDQILDTMLHELCHNVHGPHNASFYKLWDEIRKECEELMAKGITGTGEGFDLTGRRLGGFSRQPPLSSLRKTALAAAEKRARLGTLLPSGPKRLGGDSAIMVALSPIQAAAMAAERRLQDNIWCGSESCEVSGKGEDSSDVCTAETSGSSRLFSGSDSHSLDMMSRKRGREADSNLSSGSLNDHAESSFVDLSVDDSTSGVMLNHDVRCQSQKIRSELDTGLLSETFTPESCFVGLSMGPSISGSTPSCSVAQNAEKSVTWECETCTLLNPPLAPICGICNTPKPRDVGTKYEFWSCKFCTLENSAKLEKCSACGQWRYSHGAPVSTPAPNLGT